MTPLRLHGAGKVIKELRGDRKLTEIATLMGIHGGTLSKIEQSMLGLSVDDVVLFADVMGLESAAVMKSCLKAAVANFSSSPGGKIIADMLDQMAEDEGRQRRDKKK